jgi:hypothetical protein
MGALHGRSTQSLDLTNMLREMSPVRQPHGDPRRRWFASARCDLIVWLRDDNIPNGFQFCYDKDATEHALTWFEDRGFSHMRVDTGGTDFSHGRGTPLLVANGTFDTSRILELFRAESNSVPSEFVKFISEKLQELGAR